MSIINVFVKRKVYIGAIIITLLLSVRLGLNAQGNLVYNPGFEIFNNCPESEYEFVPPPGAPGHAPFKSVVGWYNVNGQTPEYFNACDTMKICKHKKKTWGQKDEISNVYRFGVPLNKAGETRVDSGNALHWFDIIWKTYCRIGKSTHRYTDAD